MNGPLREIHSALRGGSAHWKNIGRWWWASSPFLVGYCFWHCKKLVAYADKSNCEWHKRLLSETFVCLFSAAIATFPEQLPPPPRISEKLWRNSLKWMALVLFVDVDTSILQLTASVSLWRDARTLVAQYFWMEKILWWRYDIVQSISRIPPNHNLKINKPDDLSEKTNTVVEWQDKD
jgi:hypothetical protein